MKRKLTAALLALAFVALMAAPASAHRYNRTNDGHPMRLVAYALHPVGIALEYVIMRPVHAFVSGDDVDIWFGHDSNLSDDGTYDEWLHGDYEPSIKVERAKKVKINQGMVK